LHNNRRNGEPQAAFKYKYLQPEPQAKTKTPKPQIKRKMGEQVKSFLRFLAM